jgi:hypothetical protein
MNLKIIKFINIILTLIIFSFITNIATMYNAVTYQNDFGFWNIILVGGLIFNVAFTFLSIYFIQIWNKLESEENVSNLSL